MKGPGGKDHEAQRSGPSLETKFLLFTPRAAKTRCNAR